MIDLKTVADLARRGRTPAQRGRDDRATTSTPGTAPAQAVQDPARLAAQIIDAGRKARGEPPLSAPAGGAKARDLDAGELARSNVTLEPTTATHVAAMILRAGMKARGEGR